MNWWLIPLIFFSSVAIIKWMVNQDMKPHKKWIEAATISQIETRKLLDERIAIFERYKEVEQKLYLLRKCPEDRDVLDPFLKRVHEEFEVDIQFSFITTKEKVFKKLLSDINNIMENLSDEAKLWFMLQ